jgi:chromosome segregation ATPase
MAEGNETPGGNPTDRRSAGGSEGDLLSERRARRASETGEAALTRRAEAAEATVRTLEVHVSTLQERMREVEQQRRSHAERADAERVAVLEREAELRRVKQREYAEQQLRVEAEDRLMGIERESRAQIDRLNRRLSASEQEARELAQRLESVQRALAEAEQTAAAERTAVRRSERELQARLTELECRALEISQALAAERAARERSERTLESIRRGHRMVESLVGDTRAIVARLAAAFARSQRDAATPPRTPHGETPAAREPGEDDASAAPESGIAAAARSAEMAGALAAAVERLRARAEEPVPDGMRETATAMSGRGALATEVTAAVSATVPGRPERPPFSRPLPPPRPPVPLPAAARVPPRQASKLRQNKHSLSWIGRWRIRRKQRRGR